MKTLKIIFTLSLCILFMGSAALSAQTFQKDLRATLTNEYVACLNKQLSGEWVYHIAYHVDKKTGEMVNLHWNIKQCNLWDSEGNRYKCIDTGNDNIGSFLWDLWNNINAYNAGYDIVYYDVEDGWLPVPETMPEEGHLISAAFKFIGNGDKVTWTIHWIVNYNAKGELKVDLYREYMDCY